MTWEDEEIKQEDLEEIGYNITQLRSESKEYSSQLSLAVAVGIGQGRLSEIERGKRDPKVSTLIRIAEALHAEPNQVLPERLSKVPDPMMVELENIIIKIPEKDREEFLRSVTRLAKGFTA